MPVTLPLASSQDSVAINHKHRLFKYNRMIQKKSLTNSEPSDKTLLIFHSSTPSLCSPRLVMELLSKKSLPLSPSSEMRSLDPELKMVLHSQETWRDGKLPQVIIRLNLRLNKPDLTPTAVLLQAQLLPLSNSVVPELELLRSKQTHKLLSMKIDHFWLMVREISPPERH